MPAYNRFDMCNVINAYIVNSRYREVLRLRYCEGFTYEEIGEIVNFSPQHVKHICKSNISMLLSHL